jgi:hypothetical protein
MRLYGESRRLHHSRRSAVDPIDHATELLKFYAPSETKREMIDNLVERMMRVGTDRKTVVKTIVKMLHEGLVHSRWPWMEEG